MQVVIVAFLEGGMKSWSMYLEPIKVGDLSDGGELYQFVRLGKGCLSYMVISGGEAAIIDAVRFTDVFTKFAKEKNVKLNMYLIRICMRTIFQVDAYIAAATGANYLFTDQKMQRK